MYLLGAGAVFRSGEASRHGTQLQRRLLGRRAHQGDVLPQIWRECEFTYWQRLRRDREEFREAVNMEADQLKEWLETDESKSVGQSDDGGESKGHESGRRIVEILEKDDEDIGQDDSDHMRRVVSCVLRHRAQEPKEEDVQDSRWRYSLMNWGHDPLK